VQIVVYSNDCPRCRVLKKKLLDKELPFMEVSDEEEMMSLGIQTVPVMSVDGRLLEFKEANEWINNK